VQRSRFFKVIKPATGILKNRMYIDTLHEKFRTVRVADVAALEEAWTKQYERVGCLHYKCAKEGCIFGARKKVQHMVAGALLGVWGDISKEYDAMYSSKASEMKIIRLTAGSERLVGIHIADGVIAERLRKATKASASERALTAASGGGVGCSKPTATNGNDINHDDAGAGPSTADGAVSGSGGGVASGNRGGQASKRKRDVGGGLKEGVAVRPVAVDRSSRKPRQGSSARTFKGVAPAESQSQSQPSPQSQSQPQVSNGEPAEEESPTGTTPACLVLFFVFFFLFFRRSSTQLWSSSRCLPV
jgi:hypothetical protein